MVTSTLVGCRGMRARRLFLELLQQHLAATRIQAAVRGHIQRRRYLHTLAAVVTLQMGLRRWQVSWRLAKSLTVFACVPTSKAVNVNMAGIPWHSGHPLPVPECY